MLETSWDFQLNQSELGHHQLDIPVDIKSVSLTLQIEKERGRKERGRGREVGYRKRKLCPHYKMAFGII